MNSLILNFHILLFINIKTSLLCLVFFLGLNRDLWSLAGKYPIQHFSPSIYQAGNQNIDFAQNRDMTLFVANNLGVLSYNGNSWKTQAFRTGKKKRSLAFDTDKNRLYVGLQGDFGYFEENWNYVSLIDKIPDDARDFDEVWDVFIIDSEVFFCTFQGIYGYDGQSIYVIRNDSRLQRSFLANEKLYTQSQEGTLFEIQNRKLVQSYVQSQKGQIIAGVLDQIDGLLLFYNSGEIEFSTPSGTTRKFQDLSQVLKGSYVNHVLQLSDTRIAVATQTSGLFLYDIREGTIENISTRDGLATNACLRSFQDYSGNLWLGLQNGISLIHINSPMRLVNQEINLQGSGYETIETDDGTYYSTSNGIYYSTDKTGQSVFLQGTEGPAYGFQEIEGKLYAGHHTGLFLLEKNRAHRIVQTDGLWRVKKLFSKPGYAIGGTYSGLHLFKIDENQTLQSVSDIKGFGESSRFFEEDRNGDIWVGQYYKGLYHLKLSDNLKEVTLIEVSKDENSAGHEQIVLSRVDNDLFIASNSGLYKIDPSNGEIVPSEIFSEFIGNQAVYLFEQDNEKNVHVIAKDLVGFFKQISAKNYVFVHSSLNHLRYYLNNDLLSISINSGNGVFFSSNEGFIHYIPELESQLITEYPVVISRVNSMTHDSTLYSLDPFLPQPESIKPLIISHSYRVLQFNVASFHFNDVNNQKFRFFLKGFDDDYGEWTNITTKEYSNLHEGNYEFTVQTQNFLGLISTSQPMILQVKPPLHRTLYARMLYVSIGLLMLYLFYRFQSRRYSRKTEEMEKIKQREVDEEHKKLIVLEQKREYELSKLNEEKLENELRHVNNLLAASTMNLVVKNEFIESIKEELKGVTFQGKSNETKNALAGIVKGIDQSLRLQEDWEQFELHFDKVHGDFLTRLRDQFLDLSPNEQKLCALLRLNLNTKEIANLMSISLRGVEVARYRLRKKLKLKKGHNLSKFILEY